MSDDRLREAVEFLLEALQEAIIESKANRATLKLLVPPERRNPLIDIFSRQATQQIVPAFALLRESMLSLPEQTLPQDWEEMVRRLVDSAQSPDDL